MLKNIFLLFIGIIIGSSISYKYILNTQNFDNKVIIKEKIVYKYIQKKQEKPSLVNIVKKDKPKQITLLEQFKNLILNENYSEAFGIYSNTIVSNNTFSYDKFLYQHILELLNTNISKAQTLLQYVQSYTYDNFYYDYISFKISYKLNNTYDAFTKIVQLYNSYIPNNLQNSIKNDFFLTSKTYYKELLNSTDYEKIEQFIFTMQNNNINKYTYNLKKIINKLKRDEQLKNLYPIQIKLTKYNKHYLIPITINNTLKLNLLFDTGASQINIKQKFLKDINYKIVKKDLTFNTANGNIKSDLIQINTLQVGSYILNDFKIQILKNYKSKNNDGLFGQSFLNLFDWKIDQQNDILHLKPKN